MSKFEVGDSINLNDNENIIGNIVAVYPSSPPAENQYKVKLLNADGLFPPPTVIGIGYNKPAFYSLVPSAIWLVFLYLLAY